MSERRFFSYQEKYERSKVCEMKACGDNCKCKLEADHVISWYKGGKTEEDNLLVLGIVCHALRHLMDEEYGAVKMIYIRMTQEEKDTFHRLAKDINYPTNYL